LLAEANPEIRREIESLLAHNQVGLLDRPLMHSQVSSVTHINVGATRGAYRIEGALGADVSTCATSRDSTLRNICRIPLP